MHLLVRVQARTGKSSLVIVALFLSFFFLPWPWYLVATPILDTPVLVQHHACLRTTYQDRYFLLCIFLTIRTKGIFGFVKRLCAPFLLRKTIRRLKRVDFIRHTLIAVLWYCQTALIQTPHQRTPITLILGHISGGGCGAFQTCSTFSSTVQSIVATSAVA